MIPKTLLFSGRFDRPHLGHIQTITRLGKEYSKVLIVVLDYPEQYWPVQYRAQILKDQLDRSKGNYEVITNTIHFGKISKHELSQFAFDVYGSGNLKVLKHIETLGYQTIFVERSDYAAATDDRMFHQIKEIFHGQS